MQFKIKSVSIIAALFMLLGSAVYFANEMSAQEKTYKIGDRGPAGGWIFYAKKTFDGWRYLEAAPVDQSAEANRGCGGETIICCAEFTEIGYGEKNTQGIIESCGEKGIAAEICIAYRGGGKSDWFLPSKDELNLMYENLYLAGIGDFVENGSYWSSTEGQYCIGFRDGKPSWINYAWCQIFDKRYQFGGRSFIQYRSDVDGGKRVRAIRAF